MATKKDGKIWTAGMDNAFTGQTLTSLELINETSNNTTLPVLPEVWVLKIGGQSIMDRGRAAVFPILEELIAAKDTGIQFILGTGGGTRARHVYAQALDLNMPTGMLAKLGAGIPVQNARMLQMLTAKHGGIMCYDDDFEKLPLYLRTGCMPIMSGMPPNEFWEKSARIGRIPPNRTDAGVYLMGEFLGAKGVIYIKDEDGLYTDDPKKDPNAKFIPEISAEQLIANQQDDLVVERVVLEYMQRARHMKEIRIINGTKKGNITAALSGENIGTRIYSETNQ
ncbi:MAG: uridine kinase [Gammaproteobacteria bacterium]|nr:uridine kinase [Gammaproteobacteria bacterium]